MATTQPSPLSNHHGYSTTAEIMEPHPRHRQHYPLPVTPGEHQQQFYPQDIKETQHVNPAYDQQSYHPNGPHYHQQQQQGQGPSLQRQRSISPSLLHSQDATLSNFLSSIFSQATSSLSSTQSPSSTSSAPTLLTSPSLRANAGFILLCSLWYLSSAFSSNTGKSIMTRFRYPVTLTFVQFAFVAGYCVVFLAAREQFGGALAHVGGGHSHGGGDKGLGARRGSMSTTKGWGIRKPTKAMFQGTLMMSLFQIAGHVFSSMAIARVPVSTVHTIKALSPLFTVVSYALLFGVRYGTPTYLALLPLTLGVMLACSFDLRANAIGFLCALGSTVIFVSQNIFSKKLLPKESSAGQAAPSASGGTGGGKLDKLNLLFYSSGMAFFLMIPIWLYSDASTLLSSTRSTPLIKPDSGTTGSLLLSFFLNGTVHFAQNLLAFSILARTSPVTYSIASLVKRIAVICLAIIWSGQKVTPVQAVGMTMTFLGLWLYNRAKSDVDKGERKRGALEKRQEMFLPTSLEDVRQLGLDGATPPPQPIFAPTYAPRDPSPNQPRNRSLGSNNHQPPPPPPPHHQVPPPPPPHSVIVGHQHR